MLVSIGKWSSYLPFYVLDYGIHPIIGYPELKKMKLSVNCVLDSLVSDGGDRVLCNVVKMGNPDMSKERKGDKKAKRHSWAHVTLTRDVSGV